MLSDIVPEVVAAPETIEQAPPQPAAQGDTAEFAALIAGIEADLECDADEVDSAESVAETGATTVASDVQDAIVEDQQGEPEQDAASEVEGESPAQSAEGDVADSVGADATTEAPPVAEPQISPESVSSGVTMWPFFVYGALWLVFAAALGYLQYMSPQLPIYESTYYPFTVIAGVALTLAGPVLVGVLWLGGRSGVQPGSSLFIPLLLRGAIATLAGVAVWWIVLIVADAVRLGRLL